MPNFSLISVVASLLTLYKEPMAYFRESMRQTLPTEAEPGTAQLTVTGEGETEDVFAVTDLATEATGAAALALARYAGAESVTVDRRLASIWYKSSFRPAGEIPPKLWDEFSTIYETKDGWIRIHTNLRAHRDALLRVLDQPADHAAAAKKIAAWDKFELQEAVVAAGGAAALMMTAADWREHPQGKFVTQEPTVTWTRHDDAERTFTGTAKRPLAGLKVLDLTRILAGPGSTRFLAAFGAEVLRIDPPGWDELGNIPEMTPGKRCATLDLKQPGDRDTLEVLLSGADIFVHGYRADALDALGLGEDRRRDLNPSLIDVRLNAFGWTGPWKNRRGFDSLVQMSSGIAEFGMRVAGDGKPHPLTVQALDHTTGYLMAASILNALNVQRETGQTWSAKLSLAATSALLWQSVKDEAGAKFGNGYAAETEDDRRPDLEETEWGPAQRVKFPMEIDGVPAYWNSPATPLHSSSPAWAEDS